MSATGEKVIAQASKLGISGSIVILFALLYQGMGWTFLNTPEKGGIVMQQSEHDTSQLFYKVTKVTDGDTLHITIDGIDEKVRLIGINTPETVDPRTKVQCFGQEATEAMKTFASGEQVRLEYDDSQGMRDTYGRLLAYVYLEDGQMINRKMIADGYAYEYTYLHPYQYQTEFRALQNLARSSGRGLWNASTCNGQK